MLIACLRRWTKPSCFYFNEESVVTKVVESFDPVNEAVSVTPAAIEHFKRQLSTQQDANAVRLSVKQSGCTGFMYVVDLVAESRADDLHMPLAEGVELLIDPTSLPVVSGTQIDYVLEGVNRNLKFLNPNAKDYCGCGESFSVS
jgi:iron-sulfur cluster assembly accessory protein